MHKLNPTIHSQIRVTLMLRSLVAIQNSAINTFRLKNELAGFWTLLNLRLQSFYWIYCYFIYLFFKPFKIHIFNVKIVFLYFEGIFVQNTGNSYYLAGLFSSGDKWKNLRECKLILQRRGRWFFELKIQETKNLRVECKFLRSICRRAQNFCDQIYMKVLIGSY